MTKEDYKHDPIDLNNLDQMAEDVWLFLTNDKMPLRAHIKKEAFLHEVKVMIDSARQYYAKQQAIAFDVWKRENKWFSFENNGYWYQIFEVGTSRSHKLTTEQLYNQFLEQQNKDNA